MEAFSAPLMLLLLLLLLGLAVLNFALVKLIKNS